MSARARVSVLFNEPKLLKSYQQHTRTPYAPGFSALQRAEIAEMCCPRPTATPALSVSVLFNEPKLLKFVPDRTRRVRVRVSVLFNEPKLLKFDSVPYL